MELENRILDYSDQEAGCQHSSQVSKFEIKLTTYGCCFNDTILT